MSEDGTRDGSGFREGTAGSNHRRVRRRNVLKGIGLGSVGTAVSGTFSTAVRGRSSSERPATASGDDGGRAESWVQVAKLAADDGDVGDEFGGQVALAGNTVLVGADSDEDPNGQEGGSAYVFEGSGGTWRQQAKLTPDGGDPGDFFGSSVALDGGTALVGAKADEDPSGVLTGSAYVFERSGGTWHQQAKLVADDDLGLLGGFGSHVALAGNTALVGASGSGSAYVFERTGETWSQRATLVPDDGDDSYPADEFGKAVSLAGDTALVGAPWDEDPNGSGYQAGSVYVFEGSGGTWSQQAKLVPDDGDPDDFFGSSIALAGDTVLIGARKDDDPQGRHTSSSVARGPGASSRNSSPPTARSTTDTILSAPLSHWPTIPRSLAPWATTIPTT